MKKIRFANIFLFLVLQELLCLTSCFSEPPAFLDQESSHVISVLRRDTKIPIGVQDNTLHHITLPTGTPLHEIPSKISQKRTEIGLSPNISFNQQNEFFQNLKWQTTQDILIKSPMPAKVIQVLVHSGQRVNQGDHLFTLECMKMQMFIRAPSPGETTHVFLEEGQLVDQDSALIALLPPSPPWEDINQAQILDNKDLLMVLFPWAAVDTPVAVNDPPPNNGEENKVVTEEEIQPLGQMHSQVFSPSLPVKAVKALSQEEVGTLLKPPLSPLPVIDISPENPLPPSQKSLLTEQTSNSLPDLQVSYESKGELQKEDFIITSPLITGKGVYSSIVEDKSSQDIETPQQVSSPSLSSELSLFPNNQSHSLPTQEEDRNLLEPFIAPLQNIEEILVPPSQKSLLTEQTPASLPLPQIGYQSKAELQKENFIITSVYSSLVEDKSSQDIETPQQVSSPSLSLEGNFGAGRDGKTLSKIKNAVIASPRRGSSNPCFRRPIIDRDFKEMVLRTSLPASQGGYTSQDGSELHLSSLNESYILILKASLNLPVPLSKHIIPNDHIEIELEDTWDISSSTGVKWLYGLIGAGLLLFARKNKLKPSPFGYFHGVDYNKYPLITHYLADNLNFRGSPKENILRVPHLRNLNTIEWKKYGG